MLLPHLNWKDYGRQCTVGTLLRLLFAAAAQRCSLAAICARRRAAPSDQAVRDARVALCPDAEALEQQLNASFAMQWPDSVLKRGRWPLGVDVTLKPYHGQPHRPEREVYRRQPKSGTTHFHAYASCYLVKHGRRDTVALCRVERGMNMEALLKRLLRYAAEAGVRPSLLWLDRGFYSVEVIRYLQAARRPLLRPVVCRGRKHSDPRGPSGTRVFRTWKRSGWAQYTLSNAARRTATTRIGVHCRNWRGRRGRQGRQTLG